MKSRTKVVAISIAHYPESPGAGYNNIYEHQTSKIWISALRNKLKFFNIEVPVAPIGNLESKVEFINRTDTDLCLEIHFNGSYNPKVSGVETLYCPGSIKGKKLAKVVHSYYAGVMGVRDRGVKEGWYRMDRPGFEDYPGDKDGDERKDYFLQYTHCPALILEPDFISQIANIRNKQDEACMSIARGIDDYLENK